MKNLWFFITRVIIILIIVTPFALGFLLKLFWVGFDAGMELSEKVLERRL